MTSASDNHLGSWADTPTRQAIVEFMESNEIAPSTEWRCSTTTFMRPVARPMYGIPAQRVIGSSFALSYEEDDSGGAVIYKSGVDFFDDGPEKPVRIWSRIGSDQPRRRRA